MTQAGCGRLSMALLAALSWVSGVAFASGPTSVEQDVCAVLESLPFHGVGDFDQFYQDACFAIGDSDSASGSYTITEGLDATHFVRAPRDDQGNLIPGPFKARLSVRWDIKGPFTRLEPEKRKLTEAQELQKYFDDKFKCEPNLPGNAGDKSDVSNPFIGPGCVVAEAQRQQVSATRFELYGSGFAHAVTSCYDLFFGFSPTNVYIPSDSITEDAMNDLVASIRKFATEGMQLLLNAVEHSCDGFLNNKPPKAVIAADPASGFVPLDVVLDGSGSQDDEGIVHYGWTIWRLLTPEEKAAGKITRPITDSGVQITRNFGEVATWQVELTVVDRWGASDKATVTIPVSEPGDTPPPPGGDDQFEGPIIIFVNVPASVPLNAPAPWEVGFKDPTGDVVRIRFEGWANNDWVLLNEWDPQVAGQVEGTIEGTLTCNQPGTVRGRVILFDAGKHASEATEYSYTCAGGSTPPPSKTPPPLATGTPAPRDLNGDGRFEDANGNGRLDFADAVLLAQHLTESGLADFVEEFDFNGNGRLDFQDAVRLAQSLSAGAAGALAAKMPRKPWFAQVGSAFAGWFKGQPSTPALPGILLSAPEATFDVQPGGEVAISVSLTSAPNGLSGFSLELSLDSAAAEIKAVQPVAFDGAKQVNIASGGQSATVLAVDFGSAVEAGAGRVTLIQVTVRGVSNGTANLTVHAKQMDDDQGNPVSVTFEPIEIVVAGDSNPNPPGPSQRPPQITEVGIPAQLQLDEPTDWALRFADPDGDVNFIQFEQFMDGAWQPSGEGDPNVQGQTQGAITVTTTCRQPGAVRARVTLFDAAGNQSETREYAYQCGGQGGSPPGGGQLTVETLDENANDLIDDPEIRKAIQYWILGQTVPGTNQTLDDPTIVRLIKMWILGEPVSSGPAGAASLQGIGASVAQLSAPHALVREVRVQGQVITSTQLQLFDLSGRKLLEVHGAGPTLRFELLGSEGQPLANGVYLYVVTAMSAAGDLWRSGVGKLVVLR